MNSMCRGKFKRYFLLFISLCVGTLLFLVPHSIFSTFYIEDKGQDFFGKSVASAPGDLARIQTTSFSLCDLTDNTESCDNKSRVLITGVAGFVGSHVAEQILRLSRKFSIVGVDNLSAFGEVQRVNIPAGITFVQIDLACAELLKQVFQDYGPFDVIYHIAAYGGQGMSNFIRNALYTKNTMASANLVNSAINFEVKHFVFISSCAVYGSKAVAPLVEDSHFVPDDPYGISKYSTELDILAAHKQFGLNYTIFRAHNLYGPRQFLNDPFRNVISIWLRQMLLESEITIFGNGEQTRSFTYIDDVSSMIAEAPFNLKAKNQIINAGNEVTTKLGDMLSQMAEILNIVPKIKYLPVRRETSEVEPDHTRQFKIFGRRVYTKANVGLTHTIKWAKTLDWKSLGFAPHPSPEVLDTMPPAWLNILSSSNISMSKVSSSDCSSTNDISMLAHDGIPQGINYNNTPEKRIGPHLIRSTCRFDGFPLIILIDFGNVPLANNFLSANSTAKEFESESLYPLTVGFDPNCGSLQVNVMPFAQEGVWKDYYYFSSVIKSLSLEFRDYANQFASLFDEPKRAKVLEIGCNDGVFLKPLAEHGFQVFGVDPASNVVGKLRDEFTIYDTFFGFDLAKSIVERHGHMDAIVTSNSFAHIDDMVDVMRGINHLLKEDGILAIQVHYAVAMVEKMQYDWIYHEHLSYYTLHSLSNFLLRFNFEIFDARETSMHGGSIRVFAQKTENKRKESSSLRQLREKELNSGVDKLKFFAEFQGRMQKTRIEIRKLMSDILNRNKTIVGYGAPARATTLSAYIGIEFMKHHLQAVIDDSPAKQGSFMPGTHLKIISSEILEGQQPPDFVFLFAWPWVKDIIGKKYEYLKAGGSFILPLPEVSIVNIVNAGEF